MQHIFLDTEFTDVLKPRLISVGMVDETGEREFYGELSPTLWQRHASEFVQDHVVMHLKSAGADTSGIYATEKSLKRALYDWLVQRGQVTLVTDAPHYDIGLLDRLFRGHWPSNVDQSVKEYQYPENNPGFENGRPHEALQDAKLLRQAFLNQTGTESAEPFDIQNLPPK